MLSFRIRSLARDLGELLNGKAILKDLRRILIGNFNVNNAVKLDDEIGRASCRERV